jgi:probable HAF family extracellular repeat protein
VLGAGCSREPAAPHTGAPSDFGGNGSAYRAIDLGTLGGRWAVPRAISDGGVVIGASEDNQRRGRAFIYENGAMRELAGTSFESSAEAFNAAGQIAGIANLGYPGGGAMLLWEHGFAVARPVETGSFPLPDRVVGMNDRGEILLSLNEGSHISRALLWRGDALVDLGGLDSATSWTVASAWNTRGQIVGSSRVRHVSPTHEIFHPFVWENGAIRDLGILASLPCGDAQEDCAEGWASDINDLGTIVGSSQDPSGRNRAVMWENGVIRELDVFPGLPTDASYINDRGQILGRVGYPENGWFVWERGSVQRLRGLGGAFIVVRAFTERGEVLGAAETPAGAMHAFVWQNGVMTDLGPGEAAAINLQGDIVGTRGERAMLWRKTRRGSTMNVQ